MAKVSVSIPDELLERARALHGATSTSELVQRGLEQLTAHLTGADEPGYAHRPDDVDDLLTSARDRLLAAARAEFEDGYRAGAEDASRLDWAFMERLADKRFDLLLQLRVWQTSLAPTQYDRSFDPPAWFAVLARRFGSMIDPIGFDDYNFAPTRPFIYGYAAALRDTWSTVESAHATGGSDAQHSIKEH